MPQHSSDRTRQTGGSKGIDWSSIPWTDEQSQVDLSIYARSDAINSAHHAGQLLPSQLFSPCMTFLGYSAWARSGVYSNHASPDSSPQGPTIKSRCVTDADHGQLCTNDLRSTASVFVDDDAFATAIEHLRLTSV